MKNATSPNLAPNPSSYVELVEAAIRRPDFRPAAGKCVIEWDTLPTMAGLIHIPENFRRTRFDSEHQTSSAIGTVKAMTPGKNKKGEVLPEDFRVGDRVIVRMVMSDLNKRLVLTTNTRVDAVIAA